MATRERDEGVGIELGVAVGTTVEVAVGADVGVALGGMVGDAVGGGVEVVVDVDLAIGVEVVVGAELGVLLGVSLGGGVSVSGSLPGRQPAASSPAAKALNLCKNLRREIALFNPKPIAPCSFTRRRECPILHYFTVEENGIFKGRSVSEYAPFLVARCEA